MGCRDSQEKSPDTIEVQLSQKLLRSIDLNSSKGVESFFTLKKNLKGCKESILNSEIIKYKQTFACLPLVYCILKGKHMSFISLISLGASFEKSQNYFQGSNISALEVIFSNGYIELLKRFLPLYLKYKEKNNENNRPFHSFPNHVATKKGMFNVIEYTQEYFNRNPPEEFSLNYIDPDNGENCGLVACRYGNLGMLKFFHEHHFDVNLNLLNRHNENALMICLRGYLKNKTLNHHSCIVYLIKEYNIDVTYRYEDLLKLASFDDTVLYLEQQLKQNNILVKKSDLDNKIPDDPSQEYEFDARFKNKLIRASMSSSNSSFALSGNSSIYMKEN